MTPLSPSIVLVACAEPFSSGGRALVFGDATSPLAEELVQRGARLVHVFDPVAARAAEAQGRSTARQISIAPEADAEAAVRPGAFDVALIPDLSALDSPDAVLALCRRALSSRGVAFVGSPNAEAKTALLGRSAHGSGKPPLGYYELYDAVSAHFPEVKMLGQTPFVGYAVVDFAVEEEPDVTIDSELVPGGAEEPEWFVACASAEPTALGAVHLVQVPATQLVASPDPRSGEELRAARAAEAHLIERVAHLEVELGRARTELSAAHEAATSREREAELERELSDRDERLRTLRDELSAAQARADEAARLESEKLELSAALARREAELAELTRVTEPEGPDETQVLEAALREQGQRVRRLEAELTESERTGKDLVLDLGKLRESAAGQEEAAGLASENARLRADLEAAGWTISELEARLPAAGR